MTEFRIIMTILALIGMFFLAMLLDRQEHLNTVYNATVVGGIGACGIICGLCLGLLLG